MQEITNIEQLIMQNVRDFFFKQNEEYGPRTKETHYTTLVTTYSVQM